MIQNKGTRKKKNRKRHITHNQTDENSQGFDGWRKDKQVDRQTNTNTYTCETDQQKDYKYTARSTRGTKTQTDRHIHSQTDKQAHNKPGLKITHHIPSK